MQRRAGRRDPDTGLENANAALNTKKKIQDKLSTIMQYRTSQLDSHFFLHPSDLFPPFVCCFVVLIFFVCLTFFPSKCTYRDLSSEPAPLPSSVRAAALLYKLFVSFFSSKRSREGKGLNREPEIVLLSLLFFSFLCLYSIFNRFSSLCLLMFL